MFRRLGRQLHSSVWEVELSRRGVRKHSWGPRKDCGPQTENQTMTTALSQQDSGIRSQSRFLVLDTKASQVLVCASGWQAEISRIGHKLQRRSIACEPD